MVPHNKSIKPKNGNLDDFVLEKGIFSNIFEKDIRRVFIYKKAERLAKALHLIAPAFAESSALRNRIDSIALGIVDAAIVPSGTSRTALSRELLALSSVLSIAHAGGFLSTMNVDLIQAEVHNLLQEIASYEEPRIFLDTAPTLSGVMKSVHAEDRQGTLSGTPAHAAAARTPASPARVKDTNKGHIRDRRDAVMSVIRTKGRASIKDISTVIRGVSEKTIQRELAALVDEGKVVREGERRWSTYSLK